MIQLLTVYQQIKIVQNKMSKTISNLQDIEIKDLLFMKNQKTRIQEREEKIK